MGPYSYLENRYYLSEHPCWRCRERVEGLIASELVKEHCEKFTCKWECPHGTRTGSGTWQFTLEKHYYLSKHPRMMKMSRENWRINCLRTCQKHCEKLTCKRQCPHSTLIRSGTLQLVNLENHYYLSEHPMMLKVLPESWRINCLRTSHKTNLQMRVSTLDTHRKWDLTVTLENHYYLSKQSHGTKRTWRKHKYTKSTRTRSLAHPRMMEMSRESGRINCLRTQTTLWKTPLQKTVSAQDTHRKRDLIVTLENHCYFSEQSHETKCIWKKRKNTKSTRTRSRARPRMTVISPTSDRTNSFRSSQVT